MGDLSAKLLATGMIVVFAVVLSAIGRRHSQNDAILNNVLAAMALLLMTWIPRGLRDFVFVGFAILLTIGIHGLLALFAGGITWAIVALVPGGGTALFLVLFVAVCLLVASEERRQVRDIRRAKRLVPGENRQIRVAVSGPARSVETTLCPHDDHPVAAWWVKGSVIKDDDSEEAEEKIWSHSDSPLEITSPQGKAILHIDDLQKDTNMLHSAYLDSDDARRVAEKVGVIHEDPSQSVMVAWLEQGDSIFIAGVPTWQADPSGGYRDSKFVPVFRSDPNDKLVLKVGSVAAIKRRLAFSALSWGAWAIPCATVAILQAILGI